MTKVPKYWKKAKKYLSKRDKRMSQLIKNYQGPMKVTLYDINGKILITQTTTKINLEDLPSGAYQMVVKYGEKQQRMRVLKN